MGKRSAGSAPARRRTGVADLRGLPPDRRGDCAENRACRVLSSAGLGRKSRENSRRRNQARAAGADAATAAGYTSRGGGGASNTVGIVFGGSNAPGFTTPTFITPVDRPIKSSGGKPDVGNIPVFGAKK